MTDYTLSFGSHESRTNGMCAMEWVSFLAGEPHSDEPACVSPVVRALCTALNDGLRHEQRQHLLPYLTRTIGTAGDGLDPARSWAAMNWLVQTYAAWWLAAAGLAQAAGSLESLCPLTQVADLRRGLQALKAARRQARAAWAETLGAAWPLALMPWGAARAATREAGWRFLGEAAWAAARPTVGAAGAGEYVCALVREIAGSAAATLAREAPTGCDGQAPDPGRRRLSLALDGLTVSIFELLDLMLPADDSLPSVGSDQRRAMRCQRCAEPYPELGTAEPGKPR